MNKISEKSDDGHKDVRNRIEQGFFCDHDCGMEGPKQGGRLLLIGCMQGELCLPLPSLISPAATPTLEETSPLTPREPREREPAE